MPGSGYGITFKNEINPLTNKKGAHFTITELEVWLVHKRNN
jgi:hypothetical protein